MPRKRLPIFLKVSSKMLKVSIFIANMRKPIVPKLVLFAKSRRPRKFKHVDYRFVREYEFSPSRSPLIGLKRNGFGEKVFSMLSLCRCLGYGGGGFGDSAIKIEALRGVDLRAGVELQPLDWFEDEDESVYHDHGEKDDDDSIDLRAEEFIKRFYREMKLQRQKSISNSNLDLD